MDHHIQSTMLMPASYAVLSEEEMTYLDGGADYSFNVGDYTVTLHPEVLVTYAMNVVVNGVYMLSRVPSSTLSIPSKRVCPTA